MGQDTRQAEEGNNRIKEDTCRLVVPPCESRFGDDTVEDNSFSKTHFFSCGIGFLVMARNPFFSFFLAKAIATIWCDSLLVM